MFGNGKRQLEVLLEDMKYLRSRLDRIESALVVRDPGNARSVEAYDGLRNQVAMAASNRRTHLLQLVSFMEAIKQGVPTEQLEMVVREWAIQAGLEIVEQYEDGLFKILNAEEIDQHLARIRGVIPEVMSPAWRDKQTNAVIKQGTCVIALAPPPPVVVEPQPEAVEPVAVESPNEATVDEAETTETTEAAETTETAVTTEETNGEGNQR